MNPATIGLIMGGVQMVGNFLSGRSASRQQRQNQRRLMAAIREDQAQWDKLAAPVQAAIQGYLTGTETSQQRAGREAITLGKANSAMSLAAPAVQANYATQGQRLQSSLAARGMGGSGIAAKATTDLAQSKQQTLAGMRQQSIAQGGQALAQERQNYLQGMGPRPSLAGGYQSIAGQAPINTQIDLSGITQSLMSLAQKPAGS
jgi:hypothetical protein